MPKAKVPTNVSAADLAIMRQLDADGRLAVSQAEVAQLKLELGRLRNELKGKELVEQARLQERTDAAAALSATEDAKRVMDQNAEQLREMGQRYGVNFALDAVDPITGAIFRGEPEQKDSPATLAADTL